MRNKRTAICPETSVAAGSKTKSSQLSKNALKNDEPHEIVPIPIKLCSSIWEDIRSMQFRQVTMHYEA